MIPPIRCPGAPHFHWRDGSLQVEGLAVDTLADRWGTPLFIYSRAAIEAHVANYRRGLAGRDHLLCYALKANSSLAVMQVLAGLGCGFDIVSGGELQRVLAVGADPKRIVFSGVGKTRAEMAAALDAGISCFNVESMGELRVLSEVAHARGQRAPISVRVNPDVDPKTHPYISTGLKGNKFGIAHEDALAAYQLAASLPGLRVLGIDCHIGSQIADHAPYFDALERVLDLVERIEAAGIPIEHVDLGGGVGIDYEGDTPLQADSLWHGLLQVIDRRGHGHRRILIEPGRSIVGNAGICLAEVLYLKHGQARNFCIIDAAMNDLPRPAMYEAFHVIAPTRPLQAPAQRYDVVGPVCESGDWIGRERDLAVEPGARVAVFSAGAYCMSMASNYNTRGRAAELLVDGDQAHLIRARESTDDLLRSERLLPLPASILQK